MYTLETPTLKSKWNERLSSTGIMFWLRKTSILYSLFGSFQNRNYTPDSDIDILVVVAHDNHDFLERRDQFINYFKDIPFDVNIIVYTENEINKMLEKGNLFLKNILAEAREL
jgi:predicted nucleotidyltransferase